MPNMDEIPDMDDENDVDIFEEEQDDAVLERPIAEITEAGYVVCLFEWGKRGLMVWFGGEQR